MTYSANSPKVVNILSNHPAVDVDLNTVVGRDDAGGDRKPDGHIGAGGQVLCVPTVSIRTAVNDETLNVPG